MAYTKNQLSKAVKDGAAGIVQALDIAQLLGDDIANEIIDSEELSDFVEKKRDALAARIRNL